MAVLKWQEEEEEDFLTYTTAPGLSLAVKTSLKLAKIFYLRTYRVLSIKSLKTFSLSLLTCQILNKSIKNKLVKHLKNPLYFAAKQSYKKLNLSIRKSNFGHFLQIFGYLHEFSKTETEIKTKTNVKNFPNFSKNLYF